jgi:predicted nucleic acid-binding protein
VKFWDTSALIPLLLIEPASGQTRRWLEQDPDVVVWTLTRVELLSALARRLREAPASRRSLRAARRDLLTAWPLWSEVNALENTRRHAERIVQAHPLRAADALQIGAALVAARGAPGDLDFVTLDRHQGEAAEREGFRVLGVT